LSSSATVTEDDFVALVEPHLARLGRLAARLAGPANSDDVVQEALARAWQKRSAYDPARGAFLSWMFAITADQARKFARKNRVVTIARAPDAAAPEDYFDIEAAVERLPARQRLAVDCFYFADLSIAETAAVMNCPEGTVKSTLSAARVNLRRFLE
jgi:RNA polymerase sigma-70 factor (ECF subfamily)